MKLLLILFENIEVNSLKDFLTKRFNFEIAEVRTDYPIYNVRGAQISADDLIPKIWAKRIKERADFALGVTGRDLFANTSNYVFGLASPDKKVGLVSLSRLYDPGTELFLDRSIKESMHELGHVFGLEHCKNKSCVMNLSNSVQELDHKSKDFCSTCQQILPKEKILPSKRNKWNKMIEKKF